MAKLTLIDGIDKAAASLLDKISSCETTVEQVKIFEAVMAWADQRTKLLPAKKAESPISRMKAQLHNGSRTAISAGTASETEDESSLVS